MMKKFKKIAPVILALSLTTACSNTDTAENTNDTVVADTVSTETDETTETADTTETVDTAEDNSSTDAEVEQEVDLFNPAPTVLPSFDSSESLNTFTDSVNQVTFSYDDSFLSISNDLVGSALKTEDPETYQQLLELSAVYDSLDMDCFYILDENQQVDGSNLIYLKMDLGVENLGDEMFNEEFYGPFTESFKESMSPTATMDTSTPVVEINGEKYILTTVYDSGTIVKQLIRQAPSGTLLVFQLTTFESSEEYATEQFEKLMNTVSNN